MSGRERQLIELIDSAASTQTVADQAHVRESLAYGNLKLEDPSLTRAAISDVARTIAADSRR